MQANIPFITQQNNAHNACIGGCWLQCLLIASMFYIMVAQRLLIKLIFIWRFRTKTRFQNRTTRKHSSMSWLTGGFKKCTLTVLYLVLFSWIYSFFSLFEINFFSVLMHVLFCWGRLNMFKFLQAARSSHVFWITRKHDNFCNWIRVILWIILKERTLSCINKNFG